MFGYSNGQTCCQISQKNTKINVWVQQWTDMLPNLTKEYKNKCLGIAMDRHVAKFNKRIQK